MRSFRQAVLILAFGLIAAFIPIGAAGGADTPLVFEPNVGQADPAIGFIALGSAHRIEISPTLAIVTVRSPRAVAVIRMRLLGANPGGRLTPLDRLADRSQYIIGPDPTRWRTDIPNYRRVRLDQPYPGIDLVFYGSPGTLEYDVILTPDADPGRVRLEIEGGARPRLHDGDLVVSTPAGTLRLRCPTVYRNVHGAVRPIPARYLLGGTRYVTLVLEDAVAGR
jgi:hypothetical protein